LLKKLAFFSVKINKKSVTY